MKKQKHKKYKTKVISHKYMLLDVYLMFLKFKQCPYQFWLGDNKYNLSYNSNNKKNLDINLRAHDAFLE